MISRWAGPVIALTFLLSGIAVGHAIPPLGFVLVVGTFAAMPFALAGWFGVLVLLSGSILSGRPATIVVWIGSTISFFVWLYLLWDSAWQSTILMSVLYFAAMFYFLVYWPLVNQKVE